MVLVYKYRSNILDGKNEYRQDTVSLLSGEFFAAPFTCLNDPFEASVELPMSKDDEHWVTPIKQKIYDVGIYSLAKPKDNELFPDNELMWAHYANSHKGFCIEYDLDKLTECIENKVFDTRNVIRVHYDVNSPIITEYDDIFSVQRKIFGTKSKPWEYENEVRLVFETNGIKLIKRGAIKSIYFGLNIGFDEWKAIIDGLNGKGIDFYQIVRVGQLYKLECVKLDLNFKYEIVSTRHNKVVENYTILYTSQNKDKNSMLLFIKQLRYRFQRPANFTIIDNISANRVLNDYKPRSLLNMDEIL